MVIDLDSYRKTRKVALSIPFGERVKIAREDQGKSQEQLGFEVGYSQSILSRLEKGRLEWTPETVAKTALVLNKPVLLEYYCDECPVCICYRKMKPDKLA